MSKASFIASLFLAAYFPLTCCVYGASGSLKAGFAARVVNPTKPEVPIGHGSTNYIHNFHGDLRVQVMVVEDENGKRLAWMGWDFCRVNGQVADQVKKIVQEKYGIAPEAFCINASHTHSAPALNIVESVGAEYFDKEYADFVAEQAMNVVGDAVAKLEPAKLRYSAYPCTSVGINRRDFPDFKVNFKPNFVGAVDHRAQIIAAETPDTRKLLGVLVEYGCHPVTVGPTSLGPDYPGFMRDFVEKRHPGATVVFMEGCAGNVRVQMVDDDVTTFVGGKSSDFNANIDKSQATFLGEDMEKRAKQFGRDLGMAVEWALNQPGMAVTGPIEAGYEVIDLPMSKVPESDYRQAINQKGKRGIWGKKYSAMIDKGEAIPTTSPYGIQVFTLGGKGETPFIMIALGGEPFAEYGLKLGEMLQPANTMVVGYSNDMKQYVSTAEGIKQGGYEPNAYVPWLAPGPYKPEIEQMILQTALKLAQQEREMAQK